MNDEIKKAEARGYSRGYQAGKKRKSTEMSAAARVRKENAFWQRAFLAVLPYCLEQNTWKFGDEPVTSTSDRMRLAKSFADDAVVTARNRI